MIKGIVKDRNDQRTVKDKNDQRIVKDRNEHIYDDVCFDVTFNFPLTFSHVVM